MSGFDVGVIAQWAVPALFVGIGLGMAGVALYRRARKDDSARDAFVFASAVLSILVCLAVYLVMSKGNLSREQVDSGWGVFLLGSCCAAPGIGTLAAGLLWTFGSGPRDAKRKRRVKAPPPREF